MAGKTETQNQNEVVFILDRSGSMSGRESDTIGGFNSTLAKQKKESENTIVSTILFDDKIEKIHDRMKISEVPELTDKEYYTRGCTALLDAVGMTITDIESKQKESGTAPKTLFVIITDGYENASREYTYDKVKELIDAKTKEGWEFAFLGANIDAAKEASRMGIRREMAVNYHCDGEGIKKNFKAVDKLMCSMSEDCYCFSWRDDIDEDFKKRGKKKK